MKKTIRRLSEISLIFLLSLTVEAAMDRRPADNDAEPRKAPDATLRYGDHRHQYVDIRIPDAARHGSGPYPTLMVIHGGCWVRPYASAKNIGALADALRDDGYLTINVEYRTIDEAGGGWPGTFDDISTVADSLTEWAADVPIDPDRVAAIGHSAGGHLAIWALARQKLTDSSPLYQPEPHPIKGAVSLGGPGDLIEARDTWTKGCGIDSMTPLLQGPEMRDLNAASGSPAELLPFEGKQVLITGESDTIVPPFVGDAYKERAAGKGVSVTHVKLEGISHHDYLSKATDASWTAITSGLKDIFAE